MGSSSGKAALAPPPQGWLVVCRTKTLLRLQPPEVPPLLAKLCEAREARATAAAEAWASVLAAADTALYSGLRALAAALAAFDCLMGLAVVAQLPGYCRPTLAAQGGVAERESGGSGGSGGGGAGCGDPRTMVVLGGRHPTMERLASFNGGGGGGTVQPNDVAVSVEGGPRGATVLTGPNMGGKSL